ncbi:MAG: DUF1800 family protein [Planctomycetota bacterium]|nr:DUF1800 family protein [Planctomycetota bacterium]
MRMDRTDRINPLLYLPLLFALAALPACGGGGGGEPPPAPEPPLSLSYDDGNPVYRTDGSITPNNPTTTGGTPDVYEIQPALPTGLTIDPGTGVIYGAPTTQTPLASYTVTASNVAGSVDAQVNIEIQWVDFKSIAPQQGLTDADIRYFLERTHFGFDQTAYDAINGSALDTYLDTTLAAINDTGTAALETAADGNVDDLAFPEESELAQWWLYCVQESPNPLQEHLALHWHDHFACSTDVLRDQSHYWYFQHMDLIRHNAAGNVRTIAIDVSRDWSMLEYLDGRDSTKSSPNENYGREYLELFFLGVNNGYDQADIVAAAALFSGYRRTFNQALGQDQIIWVPGQHNDDDWTFLGVDFTGVTNPPADIYEQIVDVTLAHKPQGDTIGYCSRWIVRSLLRRYCYENPAQELVDQLAEMLEANNWELTPVIKTMLLSEAFYSNLSRQGFSKTPVEHVMGFVRLTGLEMPLERNNTYGTAGLDTLLRDMGNRVSQPPVVDGWPEGESWYSAQGMVDRANAINELINQRDYQTDNGIDITGLLPSPTATAQEVVTAIAERFQVQLTPEENTTLVDFLNTSDSGSTTEEPWDATNPTHIDSRLRGLLYIIAQHPQHLLR